MKRCFSMLLAFALVFFCLPAFAEDTADESEPEFELIVNAPEEAELNGGDEEASKDGMEEEADIPEEEISDDAENESSEPSGEEGAPVSGDEEGLDENISEENDGDEVSVPDENEVSSDEAEESNETDNMDEDNENNENNEDSEENADEEDADNEEESDDGQQTDEDYGIAPLSIFQEEPACLEDVIIVADGSAAEIIVCGYSLEGKKACVKIVPVGDERSIAYMRQIQIDSYGSCIINADLSASHSQLFKITVDCGIAGRVEKVFACGESDKLNCTRGLLGIGISAKADMKAAQMIAVKITDTNGNIVFAKQVMSSADGSYSLSAEFEGIDKSKEYIVSVTEGKTGRQYVKNVGMLLPEAAVTEKTCTLSGSAGGRGEVVVFGKNLTNTSEYVYELTYNSSALRVKYANLLGGNINILSAGDGCIIFTSENRNSTGNLWSGTINAVQFELLSGSASTVTLRVYEKES